MRQEASIGGMVMNGRRRWLSSRGAALALAGGLFVMLVGDRGAQMAPPVGVGIDPFDVLDVQIKNNVLIVLDTSGSMKWPLDRDDFSLGADDPASRMYMAKQAIKAVVTANQTRINIGLVSYNILPTQKTINRTQDFEGDGDVDGPFVYVSADAGAANFYIPRACSAGGTVDGFFCDINGTFANYDGAGSLDVYRSFMNRPGGNQAFAYNDPYPAGCTPGVGVLSPVTPASPAGMRCRYYMQSRLLRNNVRFTWNRTNGNAGLTATTAITCPAPPANLVAHPGTPRCFQLQDGAGGPISTFYYSSAIYQSVAGTNACGGGSLLSAVAPCSGNNAPFVVTKMDLELPHADIPVGPVAGFDFIDGHLDGDQTADRGLRADQSTPLAGTLNFIRTTGTPAFPPQADPLQKNFVILLTDGDDTCASGNTDQAAVIAADEAELLFDNTGDFQHHAETMVVGFAGAVTPARLDVIAQGGSGADINRGAATPATAVTGCPAGNPCRNAFFAQDVTQLIDMLNAAIERAATTGFFSATASVNESLPEYAATVPIPSPAPSPAVSPDPLNPLTRYRAEAFASYRASFEAGTFRGFTHGFSPSGATLWEAGQQMLNRMSPDLAGTDHTFAELLGTWGPGTAPPGHVAAMGHIPRRIFTTRQNGRDLSGTACGGACRVNLWPPDPAVVPTGLAAGLLDEPLFRKADGTQLSLAELQGTPWKACVGSNLPAACTDPSAAVRLAASKKEAREMIIAFTAGAEAVRDGAGNPVRNNNTVNPASRRLQINYRTRSWMLAESTVGTPAIMAPPMEQPPTRLGPAPSRP
jgi:hypothetical protein